VDYFSLGSEISYPDYNALVYLLRKFKRLTSDLRLGSNSISSDYGTYSVTGGLTSVGGNFILEDNVTISSNDVLLNCFYTFYFTVVDVNLSGTVNRRVISVTGDTGDNGELEVVLEPSLLESDEVILPDFKVDIVFDPHEYYTPVSSLDITLEVDKEYINVGETATVTATVLDDTGSPVTGLDLQFNFNGDIVSDTTDSRGIASASYTGTGAGWVNVLVNGKSIQFYDGNVLITEVTGNSITLGSGADKWLITTGDVVIDWGDGSTSTVNNPRTPLTHNYTDGLSSHDIIFMGVVTGLGNTCFLNKTNLTSITIPDTVTSLGNYCFYGCSGLTSINIPSSVTSIGGGCFIESGLTSIVFPNSITSISNGIAQRCASLASVTIPNSVTSLGDACFSQCSALIDYQLYWTGNNIITYNSDTMPNNTNTIFTIPQGETANYTAKGYPTSKLVERGESLTLTADKSIIQKTETSTVTATLKQSGLPLTGKTLNYQVKHGNTVISSGTKTTNSSGQATISYTGTGVGDVSVIVSYGSLLQETYELGDYILYDEATTGKKSTYWTDNGLTVTTTATETTLSDLAQDYVSTKTLNGDFQVVFEIKTVGSCRFGVTNSDKSKTALKYGYYNNWTSNRITRRNGAFTFEQYNGTSWVVVSSDTITLADEECTFRFLNLTTDRSISYRNIKAYLI